ncbi:MAG: LuxR C-terminal-related transcriptional regulator [Polyangiaceae bacterium]
MNNVDVLSILDVAYDVAQPTSDWFGSVSNVIEKQLGDGLGVIAFRTDLRNDKQIVTPALRRNTLEPYTGRWIDAMLGLPEAVLRQLLLHVSYSYGVQSTQVARLKLPLYMEHEVETWERFGPDFLAVALSELGGSKATDSVWFDSLCLNCMGTDGVGCQFVMPRQDVYVDRTPPETVEMWRRVIAHVANAYRLHLRLRAADQLEPEVVIRPNGKIEHAADTVKDSVGVEALRQAVLDADRARSKERSDPARATELWSALVEGRWSMVDQFEHGTRKYVIAYPNDPQTLRVELSHREEQVAGYVAMGHSNKLIAYELGLASSTVATHVAKLTAKLSATSRAALVAACVARLVQTA